MISKLLDEGTILSENEEWKRLEEQWGNPVDLDTEEDNTDWTGGQTFSTLDSRKTTFDSSFLFKQVRRKIARQLSKGSTPDYKDFISNLRHDSPKDTLTRQFYFLNGAIISALSAEQICREIDEVFKSVEALCSATSTLRLKKTEQKLYPDIVQCSISTNDLSFDDTKEEAHEKCDYDQVDRYIDEVFDQLDCTIKTLSENSCEVTKDTVTTLVKKFSCLLKSPVVNCNPRRKKQCSDRFRDLTDFWNKRIFEESNAKNN